jgi:GAF domain-containing protein/AmiR/NasT family two-component response regulator
MGDKPIKVLVVDDDDSSRQPLAEWLVREQGYIVETAGDGVQALDVVEARGDFDLVLLNCLRPTLQNEITLMKEIRARCSQPVADFILFSDQDPHNEVIAEALSTGAFHHLRRPFDQEKLAILMRSVVETRSVTRKLAMTTREKAWLESLLQVSHSVNSSLELDEVLEVILDEMKRVVIYDSASIQRVAPEGFEVIACRGFASREQIMGYIFPFDDKYPNYRVWKTRQPLIVDDMRTRYGAKRTRGWLGVPLIYRGEVIGLITLDSQTPEFYDEDDVRVARIFANPAAVAIWNARLYGRTSDLLEQKVAGLQTLSEISQLITSTLDLEEVLSLILTKSMELVNVRNGVLQLVDEETEELVIELQSDTLGTDLVRPRLRFGEGVTGKAAQEKRSIIVYDVTQLPWRNVYHELWPATRSELAVPLMIKDKCIGVLNLEHPDVGYFSEDEREILESLAAQAAIAIQNARRYEDLERARDDLAATEAVAWMGLFGSSWAHGVLQKTSAARNYLAALAHLLPPDGQAQELLGKIEDAVRAVQSMPIIQSLPPLTRTGAMIDLDAALRNQIPRWSRSYPHVELLFDLNCAGVRTHIDQEWLDVAIEKLVNNALKAMPDGGQLLIVTQRRERRVELTIADTGCGIPDEVRPHFLRERVSPELSGSHGTGIGALIARYILRAFGGDLKLLWSKPGQGTTLQITLPAIPVGLLQNPEPQE